MEKITGFKLTDEERKFLKDYAQKHYSSNNMTLAVKMLIKKNTL